MNPAERRVVIATPLEPELVAAIAAIDEVTVCHEPELLAPPRYRGDHHGDSGFQRSPEQERRWQALLGGADAVLGVPDDSPEGLRGAVRAHPRLTWVQGTAAGTGELVRAARLSAEELGRVLITSAGGVHAGPLAEFCMLGLLTFTKDLPRLLADQRAHRWDHRPVAELAGATVVILGLGAIGTEVARLAHGLGMHTVGVSRRGRTDSPYLDAVHRSDGLLEVIGGADALVITLPLTEQTRGMVDTEVLGRLKPAAIVVNVGRGGVIDEPALIQALRERRLAGAALDVFAAEPPAPDSPLWDLPNLLMSPHTAALSLRENERLVTLFTENLRRCQRGEDLLHRIDPTHLY